MTHLIQSQMKFIKNENGSFTKIDVLKALSIELELLKPANIEELKEDKIFESLQIDDFTFLYRNGEMMKQSDWRKREPFIVEKINENTGETEALYTASEIFVADMVYDKCLA